MRLRPLASTRGCKTLIHSWNNQNSGKTRSFHYHSILKSLTELVVCFPGRALGDEWAAIFDELLSELRENLQSFELVAEVVHNEVVSVVARHTYLWHTVVGVINEQKPIADMFLLNRRTGELVVMNMGWLTAYPGNAIGGGDTRVEVKCAHYRISEADQIVGIAKKWMQVEQFSLILGIARVEVAYDSYVKTFIDNCADFSRASLTHAAFRIDICGGERRNVKVTITLAGAMWLIEKLPHRDRKRHSFDCDVVVGKPTKDTDLKEMESVHFWPLGGKTIRSIRLEKVANLIERFFTYITDYDRRIESFKGVKMLSGSIANANTEDTVLKVAIIPSILLKWPNLQLIYSEGVDGLDDLPEGFCREYDVKRCQQALGLEHESQPIALCLSISANMLVAPVA